MPKVERLLVADGEWFSLECAVREDRTSPARNFLENMNCGHLSTPASTGHNSENPDLQPDEQISDYNWFIRAFQHVANTGTPIHARNSHNQLRGGIWEFKRHSIRITFFDTRGSGVDSPLIDTQPVGYWGHRPWPDDFEYYLRLTTGFIKTTQKTPDKEIDHALQVRKEDLQHDRP